ncbi:MAG: tRNA pseudouridine(55) synthase TruB [Candidatus Cloacimonadaceae bacterium]|jgi:tRNA pseudouridine55 synthase|nr:tRNA pseudouridine(55) synthase TruB [Candidatus Cloacimonadota bacterium]MDY0128150.1 tRNA pseudouridine(55) synthase TruB [Candidatus Cloacimonadaceae bacterium]MCB5254441.1 tRNA pseudouridine(55) synthase TruB [Candidatus Cloacimonadota bacterium]MCK9178420.1 tRNA pseudouridine(55) synthase TruB [Candidatus Cloacimonadota bacterium]MCK9242497.1 tRNA pseudouridine(55) synthase TruB [Candidatus Cloacimonadota bacterium]
MNSFLLINKAAGISSFGVIHQLRKITGIRKIGHAGTLDPFATGLLICATGQYTRLLKYAEAQSKSYEATLLLGRKSSTGDPEGEIVAEQEPNIKPEDLPELKAKVLALRELQVPLYSAIKLEGKRAYQYAREGKTPEMPVRKVEIYDFELLGDLQDNSLRYRVTVSKGTYIRALSEYIADILGTVGMTTALERTAIGRLDISRSWSLSELEHDWQKAVCPVQDILTALPTMVLSSEQAQHFLHGRKFSLPQDLADGSELALLFQEKLLGIGTCKAGYILPSLVLDGEIAQ